jgi:hypothetical protein
MILNRSLSKAFYCHKQATGCIFSITSAEACLSLHNVAVSPLADPPNIHAYSPKQRRPVVLWTPLFHCEIETQLFKEHNWNGGFIVLRRVKMLWRSAWIWWYQAFGWWKIQHGGSTSSRRHGVAFLSVFVQDSEVKRRPENLNNFLDKLLLLSRLTSRRTATANGVKDITPVSSDRWVWRKPSLNNRIVS